MDASKLYEEDFLLWTEEQARALRELGHSHTLDTIHLAEEIEDLGRRDLRDVEGFIELLYLHGLKISTDPGADAVRHWMAEVVNFQSQIRRTFTASMRQKLKLDEIWGDALRRFMAGPRPDGSDEPIALMRLSGGHPLSLSELVATSFELQQLLAAIDRLSLGSTAWGDGG